MNARQAYFVLLQKLQEWIEEHPEEWESFGYTPDQNNPNQVAALAESDFLSPISLPHGG